MSTDGPAMALTDLFTRAMASRPDGVAVATAEERLTYAELAARSAVIARALIALGVGRDDLVGLYLDRTADMVSALLGVWLSGGAYVPLDPEYPADRIGYMVEDSGLRVVLASKTRAAAIARPGLTVLAVEDLLSGDLLSGGDLSGGDLSGGDLSGPVLGGGVLSGGDAESTGPDTDDAPEALAYVIYTSGSTGRPKGVEVPRGAVQNFLRSMAKTPGIGPDDVLVAVSTLSFDIAALEIFLPLMAGATTFVADAETATHGASLAAALDQSGATMMQATPSTWRILLESGWDAPEGFKALCGGEALPLDLARALSSIASEVWNMYGPTETTIWSTCYRLPEGGVPVLVGRPIDRTSVYVLDKSMRPVPPGVQGEIYIGGAGLARGYRSQPERTAEAFVPDPFAKEEGGRLYRTGDLGRYLSDGNLECRGRTDSQVKVRGFRIELGEIESALEAHDEIWQGVVCAFGAGTPDARLVAYVVYEPGADLMAGDVRRHLGKRLPLYMVPGLVVELDELPQTPNGKVDRKALPDPLDGGAHSWGEFREPETPSEVVIAKVWTDLLDVERVGRSDNFFELGGHSLLSIRAVSAIENETGRRLDPRAFFFQNVEQLGERLDRADSPAV